MPSFYMTVVSIIQSFALGFLITRAAERYSSLGVVGWLQVAAVLQIIVLTWHVNVSHSIVYARLLSWRDSYVAFLFALLQYFLVEHARPDHLEGWLCAVAAFCGFSVVAFVDMYLSIRKERENVEVLQAAGNLYLYGILVYMGAGAIFIWSMTFWLSTPAWLPAAVVNALLLIFTYLHCGVWWRRVTAPDECGPANGDQSIRSKTDRTSSTGDSIH